MKFPHLFSPLKVGPYQLKHRAALAPLTRMRAAKPSLAPRVLNAECYAHLPLRLQHGYPLTPYDRKTFYGGDVAGYTDYPFHDVMAPA